MRLRNLAVELVSRVPARVQIKLLVAFLAMVALLILLGAVGLRVLSGMNERNEELIELQRKIAAYRQVQHDTTRQLYGVAAVLLSPDERALDSMLRQLSQFGYDLDRLQHVAEDEVDLLASVREDYDRFIAIVTGAVERARAGDIAAAREVQLSEARPLADRLERLTNQLVNVAEADMLERIGASQQAYHTSQMVVVAFALGSIILALGLGYIFSWSIIGPLTQIAQGLRQVAAGEFGGRVEAVNRDELGALAADLNRTSDELARLYGQLQRSVKELETLGEVSREISSTLELQAVLGAIAAHAVKLAEADAGAFYAYDEGAQMFRLQATHELDPDVVQATTRRPVRLGQGATGLAGLRRAAVQIPDIDQEAGYAFYDTIRGPGYRALLAVPLLREDSLVGALVIYRKSPGTFTSETVELLQTLANQSVLAIQNARLFEELEHKGQELAAASRHKSEFLANMSHELQHAAERDHRHRRDAARGRRGRGPGGAGRAARAHPPRRRSSSAPDQRDPRSVQDRSRQARAAPRGRRSCRRDRRDRADRRAARRQERQSAARRLPKEHRQHPLGPDPAAPDRAQSFEQRLQVHRAGRGPDRRGGRSGRREDHRRRHRDRHHARADRQAVPGVQPGRQLDHAPLWRHRARSRDQPQARPADGRRHRGRERGGRRHDLHGSAAGRAAAADRQRSRERVKPPPIVAAPAPLAAGETATVLVVDDEETVRDLMRRFLAREGFDVVTASDGREGLALARQLHPALITLDVLMPGMDGWSVLQALKADPDLARIPVVMLTILDEQNRGYALGAADYLTKPIERDRLRSLLAQFRRNAHPRHALVVDDDPDARRWLVRALTAEGWQVSEAEHGQAALARVRERRPDLILLDLLMPEMDGFEFLARLQADGREPRVPVVVVTAADLTESDHHRLNGAVEKVLLKQAYGRDELLRELRDLVGRIVPGRLVEPQETGDD